MPQTRTPIEVNSRLGGFDLSSGALADLGRFPSRRIYLGENGIADPLLDVVATFSAEERGVWIGTGVD